MSRSGELPAELMRLRFFSPLPYSQYFLPAFLSPTAFFEEKKAAKKPRTKMLNLMKSRNMIPNKRLQQFEKEDEAYSKSRKLEGSIKILGPFSSTNNAPRTVQEAVKRFTQALSVYVQQVIDNSTY